MWRLRVFAKTDIIRPHQENNFFDRWPCRFIQVQQFPQFFFIFIFLLNSFLYSSSLLLFKIFKAQRREMKWLIYFLSPVWPKEQKKKKEKRFCNHYGIVPADPAIRWHFSEDLNGTGQIAFLTCAHGEVILAVQERAKYPSVLRQSNKVQTVQTKEWLKQDVADQRVKKIYCCVYFSPVSFQKKDIFLPSICIRMSKFSLF